MKKASKLREVALKQRDKIQITLKDLEGLIEEAAKRGELKFKVNSDYFISPDDIELLMELGYFVYIPIYNSDYIYEISW